MKEFIELLDFIDTENGDGFDDIDIRLRQSLIDSAITRNVNVLTKSHAHTNEEWNKISNYLFKQFIKCCVKASDKEKCTPLEITFVDENDKRTEADFNFAYNVTRMLVDKLKMYFGDKNVNTSHNGTQFSSLSLQDNNFVAPHYGGDKLHFYNQVEIFNGHVLFGVHLHCNIINRLDFAVVIQPMTKGKLADTVTVKKALACSCFDDDGDDLDDLYD